MSAGPFRLTLPIARDLARQIVCSIRPVCQRLRVVGSVRRGCLIIDDLDFLAIPKFSASLLPDVPGVSLLDLQLDALMRQGRLMRAWRSDTPMAELTCKDFYVGSLFKQGKCFKVQINVSTEEWWPVELAIKTGPADFAHKLVTYRSQRDRPGFLPSDWAVKDGWKVFRYLGDGAEEQVCFKSERQFIEDICGAWVRPEERG